MGGQLEIWVGLYDINFHYDFLKPFKKMRKCICFARI